MVGADTRKERKPNRRLVGTWRSFDEEVRIDLWWEHTDITAGKVKVISRFPRL